MEGTSASKSTVQRSLLELRTNRFISWLPGKTNQANVYTIYLDTIINYKDPYGPIDPQSGLLDSMDCSIGPPNSIKNIIKPVRIEILSIQDIVILKEKIKRRIQFNIGKEEVLFKVLDQDYNIIKKKHSPEELVSMYELLDQY